MKVVINGYLTQKISGPVRHFPTLKALLAEYPSFLTTTYSRGCAVDQHINAFDIEDVRIMTDNERLKQLFDVLDTKYELTKFDTSPTDIFAMIKTLIVEAAPTLGGGLLVYALFGDVTEAPRYVRLTVDRISQIKDRLQESFDNAASWAEKTPVNLSETHRREYQVVVEGKAIEGCKGYNGSYYDGSYHYTQVNLPFMQFAKPGKARTEPVYLFHSIGQNGVVTKVFNYAGNLHIPTGLHPTELVELTLHNCKDVIDTKIETSIYPILDEYGLVESVFMLEDPSMLDEALAQLKQ